MSILIPKPLQQILELQRGDYFALLVFGDTVVCQRLHARDVLDRDEVPATVTQSRAAQGGSSA